jgi:hypothetical protein
VAGVANGFLALAFDEHHCLFAHAAAFFIFDHAHSPPPSLKNVLVFYRRAVCGIPCGFFRTSWQNSVTLALLLLGGVVRRSGLLENTFAVLRTAFVLCIGCTVCSWCSVCTLGRIVFCSSVSTLEFELRCFLFNELRDSIEIGFENCFGFFVVFCFDFDAVLATAKVAALE